jgi:hypothetical protein
MKDLSNFLQVTNAFAKYGLSGRTKKTKSFNRKEREEKAKCAKMKYINELFAIFAKIFANFAVKPYFQNFR